VRRIDLPRNCVGLRKRSREDVTPSLSGAVVGRPARSFGSMLDLADTLQVSGAIGLVLGGFIGVLRDANSGREIADNVTGDCALGAFVGTLFGMCLWIAVTLNGGVG
jgi:hypothetical protein